MIISRAHDFGFLHIPKCAGSTIRHQLRDKDDLAGRFYRTMVVPELGRINANHVPLHVLECHFPEVLAQLRAVTSYTVVRAPLDRFVSAVAQYLRAHVAEPDSLQTAEIAREADRIIAGIRADPEGRDIRNTIFLPQVAFVYLHGAKFVDHVYAMEDLEEFLDHLETRHRLVLERDQVWNPTVTYRVPGSSGPLNRIKDVARHILPARSYAAVRDMGLALLTTRGVPKLAETLQGAPHVRAFVEEHYAADLALYAKVRAGAAPASLSLTAR